MPTCQLIRDIGCKKAENFIFSSQRLNFASFRRVASLLSLKTAQRIMTSIKDEPLLPSDSRSSDSSEGEKGHNNGSATAMAADFQNVQKSFIGSNYLGMPFAFAQAGLLAGGIGVVVIAYLTDYCCNKLIVCKREAVKRQCARTGKSERSSWAEQLSEGFTYGDCAKEIFGTRAEKIIDAALAFTQFGFCVSYFVFIVSSISDFFPGASKYLLALIPVSILLLCAMLPDVKSLAPISFVANCAILFGYIGCMYYEGHTVDENHHSVPFLRWQGLPIFFGIVMSSFEGIGTVLPVEASMHSPRKYYPPMLHLALAFTAIFLASFGGLGLVRFGTGVDQIATAALPHDSQLIRIVKVALVVAILCTYPLQLFPVIQVVERYIFSLESHESRGGMDSSTMSEGLISNNNDDKVPLSFLEKIYGKEMAKRLARSLVLRFVLVALTATIAILAGDNFSYIAAVVGSVGATTLSFIMPCLMHAELYKESITPTQKIVDYSIATLGVVGGACGLVTTALEW